MLMNRLSGQHDKNATRRTPKEKEGKMFPMFVEYFEFFARQPAWLGWNAMMFCRQGILPGVCAARTAHIVAHLQVP